MTVAISEAFHELYTSPEFVDSIEEDWLPWLLDGLGAGRQLIDLQAGPGFALGSLRTRFDRITSARAASPIPHADPVEHDSSIEVVDVDPTSLPFADDRYDAATAVLSLHHLRSSEDQDRALVELVRVVKPGGLVAGLNAIDGPHFRRLDTDGSCTPIDPLTFPDRLRSVGLVDVAVTVWSFVRFVACVPDPANRLGGERG